VAEVVLFMHINPLQVTAQALAALAAAVMGTLLEMPITDNNSVIQVLQIPEGEEEAAISRVVQAALVVLAL
jgi:hypothetical protein